MIKKIFVFLFWSAVLCASTPVRLENSKVLQYAQTELPHEGILQMTEEGFLYVELPKEYVFELIPLLTKDKEVVCPPPYFDKGKIGAHITVATVPEMRDRKKDIPYLGQKVTFSILSLEKVDLLDSVLQAKAVYMLAIESDQIAEIRKKLDLPVKIRDHNFHITIAVDCS